MRRIAGTLALRCGVDVPLPTARHLPRARGSRSSRSRGRDGGKTEAMVVSARMRRLLGLVLRLALWASALAGRDTAR